MLEAEHRLPLFIIPDKTRGLTEITSAVLEINAIAAESTRPGLLDLDEYNYSSILNVTSALPVLPSASAISKNGFPSFAILASSACKSPTCIP